MNMRECVCGRKLVASKRTSSAVGDPEAGTLSVESPPPATRGFKNKIKQGAGRRQKCLLHLSLYLPSVQNKREKRAPFSSPSAAPAFQGGGWGWGRGWGCGAPADPPLASRKQCQGTARRADAAGALGGRGQERGARDKEGRGLSAQRLGTPAVSGPLPHRPPASPTRRPRRRSSLRPAFLASCTPWLSPGR